MMYEQSRKILSTVEEARRRVGSVDDDSGGAVAIGIFPTLAPFILPSTLLSLSQKYPNAVVTVREQVSEAIVDAAVRGEIDLLVEVLPFDESHFDVTPLFSDDFVVSVHQDNPLAKLDEIPIDALDDMPLIMLEDVHCLAQQIESYCINKQFVPKVLFQASQLATVKKLVEVSCGVSILPRSSIGDDPLSPIRYIKLRGERPARDVAVATVKDRFISPAAEFFVSVVKEQYQAT